MTITITMFNILGSYSLLALLALYYMKGTDREMKERHEKVMQECNDNMKKLDEYRKKHRKLQARWSTEYPPDKPL